MSWRPSGRSKGQAGNLDAPGRDHIHHLRPDAGGLKLAPDASILFDAAPAETIDLLHRNHILLHAGDFGDRNDPAASVFHALGLHHDIDGGGDLLAYGARRYVEP